MLTGVLLMAAINRVERLQNLRERKNIGHNAAKRL
jgi:hypothetical protein